MDGSTPPEPDAADAHHDEAGQPDETAAPDAPASVTEPETAPAGTEAEVDVDADTPTDETADDGPDVHAPTGPIKVPDERGELKPLAPIRLVEAALFTAGRPVGMAELMDATGLGKRDVGRAVKSLAMEYADLEDKTVLEVAMAGDKWAMQLKTKYVEHAQKLANMEIPKKVLKTLALVAFHQPLLQSDLVDMVGSKTYDHVRELHECGLIRLKKEGQSKRIVTSSAFPEYFGIPATDTEQIRTYLAEKVGLELRARTGEAPLSQYGNDDAPAEEPAEDAVADEETARPELTEAEAESEGTADEEDPRLADVDLVASESTA